MNIKENKDYKENKDKDINKNKKNDTIPSRINFIKELLGGNTLRPIIDYNNVDLATEQFTNPNKCHNIDSDNTSQLSKSTKTSLNKQVLDFYEIIDKIGGKLLYIKSGTTGHTFKGIIDSNDLKEDLNQEDLNKNLSKNLSKENLSKENLSKNLSNNIINYAVKVVAYPKKEKYGNIHDLSRPENAEIMMIRLLSYFVIKKQTPHIVLPIATFDTSIQPFVTLIKDNVVDDSNKRYLEFIEKYNDKQYHSQVSILISEWANRGDLLDFMRKYYKEFTPIHWKVIVFQLISVLAVIQSKYPAFRHNDLKANNVLVHKLKQRGNTYSYTVNKVLYTVPNIGYQVKIWDFDFACIPGIVENSKVSAKWSEDINVSPVQNRYYDIHYFFNTLIKKGFFPEIMTENSVPKELKEFINRIVPEKLQSESKLVSKRGRILTNKEYFLPDDILKKDIYFEEFRIANKVKNNLNNNLNNNNLNLLNLNTNTNTDIDQLIYEDYKKNLKK
jgi:hypothetical protein